jgi:prepilin-type N-terminal cleavage/methylation domain-containing protein
MSRQSGITLLELLVVVSVGAVILAVATMATVPWLARESMRSAVRQAGSLLQVARTEAVKRNLECRFVVDLPARTMSVVDTNGTASLSDDQTIRLSRLPSVVSIARPDSGSAITFHEEPGSVFQVDFDPDGFVSNGAGEMVLYGGEQFEKIVVYSAGGIRFERWSGSTWFGGL